MSIQISQVGISTQYSPNFTGAKLEKALELVKDKKICENMTNLDFLATQTYIRSLAYKMGVTPEEVTALSKFDGNDFFIAVHEFLSIKLGLSKNIRPKIELMDSMPNNPFYFSYVPTYNTIFVDLSKNKDLEKRYIFAALRHEFQHFLQAVDIHRHETLSVKMADMLAEQECSSEKSMMEYLIQNFNEDQIRAAYADSPVVIKELFNYKSMLEANDEAKVSAFWRDKAAQYRKSVEAYQEKVKAELGIIKSDSSLTPKIERDLQVFESVGYLNKDGTVDLKKYFATNVEDEAIVAQVKAQYEFEGVTCAVRKMKEEALVRIIAEESGQI